jgi:hypothetical protein
VASNGKARILAAAKTLALHVPDSLSEARKLETLPPKR